ncbi:MAG: hypothetical protein QG597_3514 [Actinomycetota bacterium]|jgi:hypothetical protein|nr:hypothetical protein [Actinomycetota bacterium]
MYEIGDEANGYRWDGQRWVPVVPPPPPPGPVVGQPGTGAYTGLTWDGRRWVGQTVVQGEQNGLGTASLVIGIIAVCLCGGGILAILAIVFGNTGMKRAKTGLATNGGIAKAGFILGWVALGISILFGVLYLISLASSPSTRY